MAHKWYLRKAVKRGKGFEGTFLQRPPAANKHMKQLRLPLGSSVKAQGDALQGAAAAPQAAAAGQRAGRRECRHTACLENSSGHHEPQRDHSSQRLCSLCIPEKTGGACPHESRALVAESIRAQVGSCSAFTHRYMKEHNDAS